MHKYRYMCMGIAICVCAYVLKPTLVLQVQTAHDSTTITVMTSVNVAILLPFVLQVAPHLPGAMQWRNCDTKTTVPMRFGLSPTGGEAFIKALNTRCLTAPSIIKRHGRVGFP